MKNSKRWTSVALTLALAGGALPTAWNGNDAPLGVRAAHAQGGITVLLNGQVLNLGATGATQSAGRVLVPLRGVFEALGANVDYDANTQTVFATSGATQMQLRIGSTQANVNGQTRFLDVPAQTRFGRTLVPLRFVSESLGATVSWNEAQRTVYITSNAGNPNGPINPPINQPNNPPINPPVNQQRETLSGVVTSTINAYSFTMRSDAGELLTVQTAVPLPARFNLNDRVTVTGIRGAQFQADNVVVVTTARQRAGSGRITAIRGEQLFLRHRLGETFVVEPIGGTGTFTVGETVTFEGFFDGAVVRDATVQVYRATNTTPPPVAGTNVDFTGTIESIVAARNEIRVRGDNGQLYTVIYTGTDRFNRFDRVRVRGSFDNGITTARNVTIVQ
ncbi:MAG TPA: copper amine oxidase N-terminal domain-containing protein [Abditibacteriaceae bacterium]|jgi:hypothetical protein